MAEVDAVVNFAAETHVDRSIAEPDAFVRTHAVGTYVLLETARARGVRYLQVSTDEVYGSIEEGSFTEESPLAPSSPYSATKAGADLLVSSYHHTFGRRDAHLPRLEQLRALPVPREAHPADGPQRPARRQAARLRRRHERAQLALRRGLRARHRPRARARRAGRGLQRRRPRRVPEHRGRQGDPRVHGRRRRAHRVRHRPPRPRPPLLAGLREGPRPRLGGAGALRRRPASARSTGTATTSGGGSRSARATTARTTSASTGGRSG